MAHLWDKEDHDHDDDGDDEEEAKGDSERQVSGQRTCTSADTAHNKGARLAR